jgi:hypothetical protein
MLILQCVKEEDSRIITLPAAYTDYYKAQTEPSDEVMETYFTLQGLTEVDLIIGRKFDVSTK